MSDPFALYIEQFSLCGFASVVDVPDLGRMYDSSSKREMEVASRNGRNQCSVYDFTTGCCYPIC